MMTFFLQTFLLACFVQTKIYHRCELAHVLKKNGMDGYEGYNLASWVCMAFYETGFDTKTIDHHRGGTKDYGIFHINSGLWCRENNSLSKALCDIPENGLKNGLFSGLFFWLLWGCFEGIVRLFFGPHKTGEGQHTGKSLPIKRARMG
uniref:Uncharacterized protein n=1 Tax=Pseudonaja textilis TaxID=8673 RepID=A0A670YK46_PSETE